MFRTQESHSEYQRTLLPGAAELSRKMKTHALAGYVPKTKKLRISSNFTKTEPSTIPLPTTDCRALDGGRNNARPHNKLSSL
jgi:hypothetical protein